MGRALRGRASAPTWWRTGGGARTRWRCTGRRAAANARPGGYWHLLPEASQGRKAIWDAVNPHTGRAADRRGVPPRPEAGVPRQRDEGDLRQRLDLAGAGLGQSRQPGGRVRGRGGVLGVVAGQAGLPGPSSGRSCWRTTAGRCSCGRPRGRNHATRAFEGRQGDAEWFTLRAPATDDRGVHAGTAGAGAARDDRRAGVGGGGRRRGSPRNTWWISTPRRPAPTTPARWARRERTGGSAGVPVDPALRVDTAWDLGIDDYTAIWFFQQVGREVRVIDYFETSGVGLDAIMPPGDRGQAVPVGDPPPAARRDGARAGDGAVALRDPGVAGPVADPASATAADPEERVNAARLMIPMCWFDEDRCAGGLERLADLSQALEPGDPQLFRAAARPGQPRGRRLRGVRPEPARGPDPGGGDRRPAAVVHARRAVLDGMIRVNRPAPAFVKRADPQRYSGTPWLGARGCRTSCGN